MAEFVEFEIEGVRHVHVLNPLLAEFSLCGYAFDESSSEGRGAVTSEFQPTSKRVVTCPSCRVVIEDMRGVRTK